MGHYGVTVYACVVIDLMWGLIVTVSPTIRLEPSVVTYGGIIVVHLQ